MIDTTAHLCYPGPLYRIDEDENGIVIGRTLVEEGSIWLIKCWVETVQTVKPIVQEGIWDSAISLNIEDWAGNYGVMPNGEHDNVLEFANIDELISFMEGDLGPPVQVAPEAEAFPGKHARAQMAQERKESARGSGRVG